MTRAMVFLLAVVGLSAAQGDRTFTGVITDDMCATGSHAAMQMGDTDAECVKACIDAHGASYVLYDGTRAYQLSDQQRPEAFAGRRVQVVGTLDDRTHTIQDARHHRGKVERRRGRRHPQVG